MRYTNPVRPQTTPEQATEKECSELFRLLLMVSVIVIIGLFAFSQLAYWLAPKIPFNWEREIAASIGLDKASDKLQPTGVDRVKIKATEARLQARAERISAVLGLPEDMFITVHYLDTAEVNAVATLGGHISVFRGLLETLEYEEELDAVLAHEIGHVMHRHLARHLSRALTTSVALQLLGIKSSHMTNWLLGDIHLLQQLAYSRDAEREADNMAILASQKLYGHTEGSVMLFEKFQRLQAKTGVGSHKALEFFESHPVPETRKQHAGLHSTNQQPRLTPLVPDLL